MVKAAITLSVILLIATPACGLSVAQERNFLNELGQIIKKHPRYVWGGSQSEEKGLDCSGYVYLAARRAGIVVRRTTSRRMFNGFGGWTHTPITRSNARGSDICWWQFSSRRPAGHVGVLMSRYTVTHASSRRGVVVDRLKGYLLKKLIKIGRLHG